MKPRPAPVPLCSLAAAFAAVGLGPPPPDAPSPRLYPTPPWRKSTPVIQPPPPPIAARWEVEVAAEMRKVYIESTDKATGKPCLIPSTLLIRTATLTSAAGHSYELATTSRVSKTRGTIPGSTVRVMHPKDTAMRSALAAAIAEIELTGNWEPGTGKRKPRLCEAARAEIASLRAEMALLGTRHLPDTILADLSARIGTDEARVVIDFLFSK